MSKWFLLLALFPLACEGAIATEQADAAACEVTSPVVNTSSDNIFELIAVPEHATDVKVSIIVDGPMTDINDVQVNHLPESLHYEGQTAVLSCETEGCEQGVPGHPGTPTQATYNPLIETGWVSIGPLTHTIEVEQFIRNPPTHWTVSFKVNCQ